MENISKAYSGTPVLSDLTFTAMPGDLTVVYGPPAAGKSVLVRVLTGLEQPDSGRIILRGQDVTHEAPAERNIGYVPQSFALYPHLSVRSNISIRSIWPTCRHRKREKSSRRRQRCSRSKSISTRSPTSSVVGRSNVAIARGIAKRTDFFVLDDPWRDSISLREQLVDDLRGLNTATGASILYVTSDVIEATLADELAVLAAGSVIEHGLPEALYRDPHNVGTMALVGFPPANFLRGSLQRGDGELWCRPRSLRSWRTFNSIERRPTSSSGSGQSGFASHAGSESDGADGRALQFSASVVLREDLGGDIVYLGRWRILTMVDRDHERGDDLDQQVTVSIFPATLPCSTPPLAFGYQLSAINPPLATLPVGEPCHSITLGPVSEIRVEQLTKTFGALRAVDDVSFTFPSGQVTCGPSGCGKTTLMRIIAGLETQTAGSVISATKMSPGFRRASATSAWSSSTRSSTAASASTATSSCRCNR